MDDIEKRVKETLPIVFEVPVSAIDQNASLHTLKEWDSLNHMKMIIALEEEFSIKMDQPEIEAMINFYLIKATISSYLDQMHILSDEIF